jgi:hypothetical protein
MAGAGMQLMTQRLTAAGSSVHDWGNELSPT